MDSFQILFYVTLFLFLIVSVLYLIKYFDYKNMTRELYENRENLSRLNELRDSMLEITQAVVGTENPNDLYEMILNKAIMAIPNANVGSVMIKENDGLFHCISQQGFDHDKIKDFALPLEETILWKCTNGKISKTEIVDDVNKVEGLEIFPLSINSKKWHIRSSISVPLFVEKEIKGIVHIDSKEINAFTQDDWTAMEYIRGNIEVALQKFLLYTKMVKLSRFDDLTQAYNRAYFMEQFSHILNNAARYKQTFALGIFDINDLKKVNDSHGHIAGDQTLKVFASVTLNNIRKTDIFARWGGDEFISLFYQINETDITDKISKIRNSLNDQPVKTEKSAITAQFSFGYASYPDDGTDFDKLLKIADNRMYMNKHKMKNGN